MATCKIYFLFSIFCIFCAEATSPQSVIAETRYGRVEGLTIHTEQGNAGDVYRGIPYAKAPVRELRFKKPQPPEKWTELKDCTEWSPRCLQFNAGGVSFLEKPPKEDSEDCLTVNVYTKHKSTKKLPVFFFIHGGAWTMGSAYEYGLENIIDTLVKRDVVVVFVQYRLGPLGFMPINNQYGTSNVALWDLNLALQWVQENIANFGGDPNKVTVGGQSAGGTLSSLLDISKHSTDKFHQLILMSGTSQMPHFREENAQRSAKYIMAFTGCDLPNDAQKWDCLRSIDAEKLQLAFIKTANISMIGPFQNVHIPFADKEFFDMEGNFMMNSLPYSGLKDVIEGFVPDSVYPTGPLLRRLANHEYVLSKGDKDNDTFIAEQFAVLCSDIMFYAPAQKEAVLRAKGGAPLWLYDFSYWAKHHIYPVDPPYFIGSYHTLNLAFLFGKPVWSPGLGPNFKYTKTDLKMIDDYAGTYAEFINTGKPSTDTKLWPKFSTSNPYQYTDVNTDVTVKQNYHRAGTEFWNYLIPDLAKLELKYPGKPKPETDIHMDVNQLDDDEYNLWINDMKDEL